MGIGTFGSFTQARLAIYAAQSGLTVTGNNISNINTPGYTRQRLDQESLYIGGADRYTAKYDLRIGQGVLASGVSQIRDPYLDIRFRSEQAKVGYQDTKLGGLQGIATILDEVAKGEQTEGEHFGIIGAQIENIASALERLTTETGHQEFDIQVRSAVESLCQKLNSYAAKLEEHYNNVEKGLVQDVKTVNSILTGIRDLNESIRNSEIHGHKALELRDERNLLIDQLSEYMQIDVKYEPEDIGGGEWVEKCVIKLGDANPDPSVKTDSTTLIDGIFGAQISIDQVPQKRDPDYKDPTSLPYLDKFGNPTARASEAQTTPKLNENGEMVNDKNEVVTDANDALWVPVENPDYLPYLSADGKPTKDPDEARLVNNPDFDMTVSELRDCRDNLFYYTSVKTTPLTQKEYSDAVKDTGGTTQETDKDTGVITITVYGRDPDVKDPNAPNAYFKRVYTKTPSGDVHLDDNDMIGALQAERELLTENGEFTDLDVIANVDEKAATKRGIPYYQRSLDLLANQIATVLNEANQGYRTDPDGNYITPVVDANGDPVMNESGRPASALITIEYVVRDKDGNPVQAKDENGNPAVDGGGNPIFEKAEYALNKYVDYDDPKVWDALPQEVKDALEATNQSGVDIPKSDLVKAYLGGETYQPDGSVKVDEDAVKGIFDGGNLLSNHGDSDDDTDITASNISIAYSWSKGDKIVRSFTCAMGEVEPASGDSENVLHLEGLFHTKMDYSPTDLTSCDQANGDTMFNGTFGEMWNNIGTVLGDDQKKTTDLLNTYYKTSVDLDTQRDSVSSVDFNDEAMNLMMYAKSYNAACRLMTTLDSVLDKLVNGTGLTT